TNHSNYRSSLDIGGSGGEWQARSNSSKFVRSSCKHLRPGFLPFDRRTALTTFHEKMHVQTSHPKNRSSLDVGAVVRGRLEATAAALCDLRVSTYVLLPFDSTAALTTF
ncbi:hypothetical protein BaRGS_00007458, partial [Batillaria attramentaria]